jgi:hypothetical protein
MRNVHNLRTRFCLSLLLFVFSFSSSFATSIRTVKLAALFEEADKVVLIKILSGDSEHYETVVYKAVVEVAYKGATKNETIFFGPFEGYAVGSEYILFLRRGAGEKPTNGEALSYGSLQHVDRIMYAGYAALAVGYDCVFDGADANQRCDDSVQLNPEQVILPSNIEAFPQGEATAVTNYKKWVRRAAFIAELQAMKKKDAVR